MTTRVMQSKCQKAFPCPASKTSCRSCKSKRNVIQISFVSSIPPSSLSIATYSMSLDQPSFNQEAYLWKQRGTIIHGQPLLYHQSTSSQSIPSHQIQYGVLLFISCFLNFLSVKLAKEGFWILFGINLINCMYLTTDKPNAESKSGLNNTLIASCRVVHDIGW